MKQFDDDEESTHSAEGVAFMQFVIGNVTEGTISRSIIIIQVSQAQLPGVQECRSDASLRSVDDSDACMVSFVYHSQSNCLHSCLLHSCYFSTCES